MPAEQNLSKKVFLKIAVLQSSKVKSVVSNSGKIFVKEFMCSKIIGLLPVALVKELLHRHFSRCLVIDFRMLIFTERLCTNLNLFMKSVFVC